MKGTLVGAGIQAVLNLRPRLFWDARQAMHAIGPAKAGGPVQTTMYETTSGSNGAKWLVMSGMKRWSFMANAISTDAGLNECLGPVGAFYAGTTNYFTAYTTAKYGFAVVAPTGVSQLTEDAAEFPSILKDGSITTSRYRIYLDTSLDAVNNCVIEKSQSRSSSYTRSFQVLVRNTDGFTDPNGNIELGWNSSAGTRTTSTPQFRNLEFDGWRAATILVASGTTSGYLSIKAIADTGVWEIALPLWHTASTSLERITRAGICPDGTARLKYALKTVNAEMVLRPTGWLAMSVVLPDRSISNGYTNNAGAANYSFGGFLNLDCGTWRLRVSMSDTYDRVVATLGDTSGVNFAYLDGPNDWNDFAALGIVVTWFISNGSTFAALYINGTKMDSVQDPATWYPQTVAPGTMYVGISADNGSIAEAFISRVAYGMDRMHRSTARALSVQMKKLARGANTQ